MNIINIIKRVASACYRHDVTAACDNHTFYPQELWVQRGEDYGNTAELVVVHDGGPYAPFFNMDYDADYFMERMDKALNAAGYYAEPCTTWYTAIYKLPTEE